MDDDTAPMHPSSLIAGGLFLAIVGGVLAFAVDSSAPLQAVGYALCGVGGLVAQIGVIGTGVLLALRLADWETGHPDEGGSDVGR